MAPGSSAPGQAAALSHPRGCTPLAWNRTRPLTTAHPTGRTLAIDGQRAAARQRPHGGGVGAAFDAEVGAGAVQPVERAAGHVAGARPADLQRHSARGAPSLAEQRSSGVGLFGGHAHAAPGRGLIAEPRLQPDLGAQLAGRALQAHHRLPPEVGHQLCEAAAQCRPACIRPAAAPAPQLECCRTACAPRRPGAPCAHLRRRRRRQRCRQCLQRG